MAQDGLEVLRDRDGEIFVVIGMHAGRQISRLRDAKGVWHGQQLTVDDYLSLRPVEGEEAEKLRREALEADLEPALAKAAFG
jgi:hypothetical protein